MDIFKTLLIQNPPNLALEGQVSYQGTWDASANSPALTSSVGTKGYYYVVSTSGSTNLNGVTTWTVGDWAIFNGAVWQKVDNTDAITSINGTTNQIVASSSTGDVTLSLPTTIANVNSITAQSATNLTLNGGSSGASIVAGQGTNANITLTPSGTGVTQAGKLVSDQTIPVFELREAGATKAQLYTASGQLVIQTNTAAPLVLSTNGVAALTLNSSQNATFAGNVTVSGKGLFAAGTGAAPTISFTVDTTKGFYSSNSNEIGLAIAGAGQLYFGGGGRVFGNNSNYLGLPSSGAVDVIAGGTNQNITLTPTGSGNVTIQQSSAITPTGNYALTVKVAGTSNQVSLGNDTGYAWLQAFNSRPLAINPSGNNVLLGTTTDSSNGKLQLATHTTSAGGIGFGTDTSLYRSATGAGALELNAASGVNALFSFALAGTKKSQIGISSSNSYFDYDGSLIFRAGIGGTTTLTLDSSQNAIFSGTISRNGTAGNYRVYNVQSSGVSRWAWGADNAAESGSNAGSDFVLYSFNDAGSILTNPVFKLTRSTGDATFAGHVQVQNGKALRLYTPSNSGYATINLDASNFVNANYQWKLVDTTASTSTSTGALIVSGGVGVAGALYTGGNHQIGTGNQVAIRIIGSGIGATPTANIDIQDTNDSSIRLWRSTNEFVQLAAARGGFTSNNNVFLFDVVGPNFSQTRALSFRSSIDGGTSYKTSLQLLPFNNNVDPNVGVSKWISNAINDNSTVASGTNPRLVANQFEASSLTATNASVTTTDAATVYITGGPTASTNQTITNSYGLWNVGKTRLDNTVLVGTGTNSSNGIIQLATHTTSAGGIGFGTDVTLSRSGPNSLNVGAALTVNGGPILNYITGGDGISLSGNDATNTYYLGANYYNYRGTEATMNGAGRASWRIGFDDTDSTGNMVIAKRSGGAAASAFTSLVTVAQTGAATFAGAVYLSAAPVFRYKSSNGTTASPVEDQIAGFSNTNNALQGAGMYAVNSLTDNSSVWLRFKTLNTAGTAVTALTLGTDQAATFAGSVTSTGQLIGKGTATNDNAATSYIGEYVSSTLASGSAISLSTGTSANVTSISLTAGDWDVDGVIHFAGGAITGTQTISSLSNTSTSLGSDDQLVYGTAMPTASTAVSTRPPSKRYSLSSTTTIFLVARMTFSSGSPTAFGTITARRAR